jgi:hypothetical protein
VVILRQQEPRKISAILSRDTADESALCQVDVGLNVDHAAERAVQPAGEVAE